MQCAQLVGTHAKNIQMIIRNTWEVWTEIHHCMKDVLFWESVLLSLLVTTTEKQGLKNFHKNEQLYESNTSQNIDNH
jgi:hypothetical protein